jgi:hypothetical protein
MPAPVPIPHSAVDVARQLRQRLADRDRTIAGLRRDLALRNQQLAALETARDVARRLNTWGGVRRENSGP